MKPSTIKLLLALVSQEPGFPADDILADFSDWEGLTSKATGLRLAPLLACWLRSKSLLGLVPFPVRKNLIAAVDQNLGHNIACASLTARIINLLGAEGIETVLLKGIAHIHDCYPDFEGRVSRDIDLLVRKNHLARAAHCVERAGFYPDQSEKTSAQHHHLPPFLSDEGQAVEIHWNLVHPLSPVRIKEDELWKLVRPCAAIPGSLLLHPIDSLIHASVHLMISSDIAQQVYQLIDIDRLIKVHFSTPEIFAHLIDRAVEFACEVPLSRSLHIAQEFLGTPIPARVQEDLGCSRFPGRIIHHLIKSTIAGPSRGVSGWRYAMYCNLLDYRKLMLRMNNKPRQVRYLLTRPGAMLIDSIKFLGHRIFDEDRGPGPR